MWYYLIYLGIIFCCVGISCWFIILVGFGIKIISCIFWFFVIELEYKLINY